ncbi:MAG: nucleotide exchange factor GrpE [Promethearchaeota archaeon]
MEDERESAPENLEEEKSEGNDEVPSPSTGEGAKEAVTGTNSTESAEGEPEKKEPTPLELAELRASSAEKERDEWRERYVYLRAEFENYQKRQARLQEQWERRFKVQFFRELLPFVDAMESAVNTHVKKSSPSPQALASGLEALHRKIVEFLRAHDVAPVEAQGKPLDVYKHEVVLSQVVPDEVPEDTVVGVCQKGWMMGSDVLRHAKVIVGKHEEKREEKQSPAGKEEREATSEERGDDQAGAEKGEKEEKGEQVGSD